MVIIRRTDVIKKLLTSKFLTPGAAILAKTGGPAFARTAVPNPGQGQLATPYGAGPSINNTNVRVIGTIRGCGSWRIPDICRFLTRPAAARPRQHVRALRLNSNVNTNQYRLAHPDVSLCYHFFITNLYTPGCPFQAVSANNAALRTMAVIDIPQCPGISMPRSRSGLWKT
jgi:hypothetical protein